jgi:hypothetical protein
LIVCSVPLVDQHGWEVERHVLASAGPLPLNVQDASTYLASQRLCARRRRVERALMGSARRRRATEALIQMHLSSRPDTGPTLFASRSARPPTAVTATDEAGLDASISIGDVDVVAIVDA